MIDPDTVPRPRLTIELAGRARRNQRASAAIAVVCAGLLALVYGIAWVIEIFK